MDGVAQRQRHAAFGGDDAGLPDVVEALVVGAEAQAPLGLDGPRRRVLDHVDDRLPGAFGDLREGGFGGRRGAGVAFCVERHVGDAAVRRDGRWLPLGELERRHVGGSRPVHAVRPSFACLHLRCVQSGKRRIMAYRAANNAPAPERPQRSFQGGVASQSKGSMPSSVMSQTDASALSPSMSRKPMVPYWVS